MLSSKVALPFWIHNSNEWQFLFCTLTSIVMSFYCFNFTSLILLVSYHDFLKFFFYNWSIIALQSLVSVVQHRESAYVYIHSFSLELLPSTPPHPSRSHYDFNSHFPKDQIQSFLLYSTGIFILGSLVWCMGWRLYNRWILWLFS